MIVEARRAHIPLIAASQTEAGRRELAEVYGFTPTDALSRNFDISPDKWTMLVGDVPLAMFGVAPISVLGGTGEIWFCGSEAICLHKVAFARMCRRFLPRLFAEWRELHCLIEHGRADVMKWALWGGASITPADERMSRVVLRRNR